MKYKLSIFVILLIVVFSLFTIDVKADSDLVPKSRSACLMEVETGKVLYEYNSYIRGFPASMTKMMTMKLVLDGIESKRITMDQMITSSEYASKMGGSQIYLSPGEKMSVDDLFKSMVIASANDAAVALAEAISGSERHFVELMNNGVEKYGLKNTHFSNCTGLPIDDHYTSSYDMAVIARELLLKHEDMVIPYSSCYEDYIRKDSYKPFWLVNTNKLLKYNEDIDGLKTGWTNEAGYCITTTMKKDGMRLICVVMGSENPTIRNNETLEILNYGFNNYELVTLKDKGEIINTEYNVLLDPSEFQIITSKKLCYVKNKMDKNQDIKYEITIDNNKIEHLFKDGVGTIKAHIDEDYIVEVDLELKRIPKKNNFFQILYKLLYEIF